MKKYFILMLFLVLFAGCAGREANPVSTYMPGDENLSCTELKGEIMQLRTDMKRLLPKTDKNTTNILSALTGTTILFMDLKQGEKFEFDAMRRRHNRLLIFAAKKECDLVTFERILSIEKRKTAGKTD